MVGGFVAVVCSAGISDYALVTSVSDRALVSNVEGTAVPALGGHIVKATLTNMVLAGNNAGALALAFGHADARFAAELNAADGGGANVGARALHECHAPSGAMGHTFTPLGATGPNAVSRTDCHPLGGDDGGGNVHRDANHLGS